MSTDTDTQSPSARRAAAAVRDLHPGYFAFVTATGIISTGAFLLGPFWLSRVLLAAACAELVVLAAALAARLVYFRSSVAADIRAPDRVFGFFTITAGLDVLGVRLELAGHRDPRWRGRCRVAGADRPLTRRIRAVPECRPTWPDASFSWNNRRPGPAYVARRLAALAPRMALRTGRPRCGLVTKM